MYVPSRLEKYEQCVSVAAHSPITTHEAARNGKDGRLESIRCTIILIQKSTERAQLNAGATRGRLRSGFNEILTFCLSLGLLRDLPITRQTVY